MTSARFIQTVLKRECPYGPVLERLRAEPELLYILAGALKDGIRVASNQDLVKKAVFYGKTCDFYKGNDPAFQNEWTDTVLARLESDPRLIRLIHAFIGMMNEAGELQEQIQAVVFEGATLDMVNVEEELGDAQWYPGVAIDAIGSTFERVFDANDAKLEKRYGPAFSEEKALNRDLEGERVVLEGAIQSVSEIASIPKSKICGGTLKPQ